MDIVATKKYAIAVLLLAGVTSVLARPPEPPRPIPHQAAGFHPQNDAGPDAARAQKQRDEEQNQRRGKLSPDERRELRRQIDEAGQDIYRYKR